jgi:hypothetical protein
MFDESCGSSKSSAREYLARNARAGDMVAGVNVAILSSSMQRRASEGYCLGQPLRSTRCKLALLHSAPFLIAPRFIRRDWGCSKGHHRVAHTPCTCPVESAAWGLADALAPFRQLCSAGGLKLVSQGPAARRVARGWAHCLVSTFARHPLQIRPPQKRRVVTAQHGGAACKSLHKSDFRREK